MLYVVYYKKIFKCCKERLGMEQKEHVYLVVPMPISFIFQAFKVKIKFILLYR